MSRLHVEFPDNVLYQRLSICDKRNPMLWTVTNVLGVEHELSDAENAKLFFTEVENSLRTKLDRIYVSVAQDAAGRHSFVSLGAVEIALGTGVVLGDAGNLTIYSEAEVKQMRDGAGAQMLFAKAAASGSPTGTAGYGKAPIDSFPDTLVDDLCPKKSRWGSNYDVIPTLSLGRTQRLILCDEQTLMKTQPDEKIFEYLKLIVNCHENKVFPNKYHAGTCSVGEHPAVICQAVHGWYGNDTDMNKRNDEIQVAIWENLQHGSVAVHCLAGIHRAACIVACHFLWRHYTLGHTEIPADPKEIYRRLQAARPAVDPAYEHVLKSYQSHLQRRAAQ